MSAERAPTPDPRVLLAAERTMLAWIRTALALMGFGFVVARFGLFLREMAASGDAAPAASHGFSLWIGVGLVALGVVVLVGAGERYRRYHHAYTSGVPQPAPGIQFILVVNSLLVLGGIGLALYLAAAK